MRPALVMLGYLAHEVWSRRWPVAAVLIWGFIGWRELFA